MFAVKCVKNLHFLMSICSYYLMSSNRILCNLLSHTITELRFYGKSLHAELTYDLYPRLSANSYWLDFVCHMKSYGRLSTGSLPVVKERLLHGRSRGTWTPDIMVPNHARYQLRYTSVGNMKTFGIICLWKFESIAIAMDCWSWWTDLNPRPADYK